jgi:hypothetical protein
VRAATVSENEKLPNTSLHASGGSERAKGKGERASGKTTRRRVKSAVMWLSLAPTLRFQNYYNVDWHSWSIFSRQS